MSPHNRVIWETNTLTQHHIGTYQTRTLCFGILACNLRQRQESPTEVLSSSAQKEKF